MTLPGPYKYLENVPELEGSFCRTSEEELSPVKVPFWGVRRCRFGDFSGIAALFSFSLRLVDAVGFGFQSDSSESDSVTKDVIFIGVVGIDTGLGS